MIQHEEPFSATVMFSPGIESGDNARGRPHNVIQSNTEALAKTLPHCSTFIIVYVRGLTV